MSHFYNEKIVTSVSLGVTAVALLFYDYFRLVKFKKVKKYAYQIFFYLVSDYAHKNYDPFKPPI